MFLPQFTFWQSKRPPEPAFREQSPDRLVVQEEVFEVLVIISCREQTWAGIAVTSPPGPAQRLLGTVLPGNVPVAPSPR